MKTFIPPIWLIALFLFTPTVSQAFNSHLLVGRWQCQAQADTIYSDHFDEKLLVVYQPNGTYLAESVIKGIVDNETFVMKVKGLGKWAISENTYTTQVTKVLDFAIDNQEVEKKYEFEKSFKQDKIIDEYLITTLSKNTFSYEAKDDIGTTIVSCQRIHKK